MEYKAQILKLTPQTLCEEKEETGTIQKVQYVITAIQMLHRELPLELVSAAIVMVLI